MKGVIEKRSYKTSILIKLDILEIAFKKGPNSLQFLRINSQSLTADTYYNPYLGADQDLWWKTHVIYLIGHQIDTRKFFEKQQQ